MKKLLLSAIASLAVGSVMATNVVSSANVVGYNQISAVSNQYYLIALDFNNQSNTINALFGSLPVGSTVSLWNPTAQSYVVATKIRTGWGANGTNVIGVGSGAFLKVPSTTNVYLSGNVPTASTTTLNTVNGYKIMSFPYPADMAFTNTALAKGAVTGDKVSFWNGTGWDVYSKIRTGWSPSSATNAKIVVGQAVFYSGTTNRVVNEVKPYVLD